MSQKFSQFKGIFRIPTRKPTDDREADNHPYAKQSRSSRDPGVKPYMSQPILGLAGNNYHQPDHDGETSSEQSVSPSRPTSQVDLSKKTPPDTQKSNSHTLSAGLAPAAHAGLSIGSRTNVDALPAIPNPRPFHTPLPLDTSSKALPPTPVATPKRPRTPGRTGSGETSGGMRGLVRTLSRTPSMFRLRDNTPTPSELPPPVPPLQRRPSHPSPAQLSPNLSMAYSPTSPTSSISPFPPPVSIPTQAWSDVAPSITRPKAVTASSTPAITATPPVLDTVIRTTLSNSEAVPQRPKLTLPPPNHRFSVTLAGGSMARLSPSVILRPPPLPILHLPQLPTATTASPTVTERRSRLGLKNMPALPLQGTSRGAGGQEENDDGEEDDEDDDDDEVEDDMGEGSSGLRHDDEEPFHRPSISSETSSISLDRTPSRSSSYKTAQADPSPIEDVFPPGTRPSQHAPSLPLLETSPIDLSFFNSSQTLTDIKGKAALPPALPSILTQIERPNDNDYFNSRIPDADERAVDRTPHPHNISPVQTPRPTDRFRHSVLPPPRLEHLSSLHDGPSLRPGMNKRASRSLIDIHAMAKKEMVEMIVREEEDIQEKTRRRQSRLGGRDVVSIVVADTDANRHVSFPLDSLDAPGEKKKNRMSVAPPYDPSSHPLRKRRSMPTFSEATEPPPYPDFAPRGLGRPEFKIQPREDEGKEKLPAYSNPVYLKAIMPRKVEFSTPGVQARDRKWRRVLCVLEGTAFKVYKCPGSTAGVSAIGGWWESKVGVGSVTVDDDPRTTANAGLAGSSSVAVNGVAVQREKGEVERRPGGIGQMELQIPSPRGSQQGREADHGTLPATRSALSVAVGLLKPSRHGRSNSDLPPGPAKPKSPRPSLNISQSGSTTPTSSSSYNLMRSNSPVPPSSSHGHGMSSGVPSPSSSQLFSRPSTAMSTSSRRSQYRPPGHAPHHSSHSSTHTPSVREKGKEKEIVPNPTDLIRAYTMQHAESGLGNDYLKRKNVIRVRLEGEQFLLQAQDVASVIQWIEALQSSTNISLDLDERPMPRGPFFPRRRRRRRPAIPTDTVGVPSPLSATAAAPALRRTS